MTPIEALADCIMDHNNWIPKGTLSEVPNGSRSWRNRNPGNLRATSAMHLRDNEGYRIFASLVDGYQALLADIQITYKEEDFVTKRLGYLLNKYFSPIHFTLICHRLTIVLMRPIKEDMLIHEFLGTELCAPLTNK